MFKKILVPVDSSQTALNAARYAVKLARNAGASVTLMYAMEIPYDIISYGGYDLILDQMSAEGIKLLDRVKNACDADDVILETKFFRGSAANEILLEQKNDYDLIVIGNRGMGEIKGFLIGSVSRKVICHADCPVLVIK